MRRLLLLIIALATLLPSLAFGYDVLVLQSRRDHGYEEVLKGYHSGSNSSERVIVMSDYAEVDVARIVREERPKVILAIGDAALTAARKIRQIPVVAVMALGIHSVKNVQSNLTGIGLFVQPERYIDMFRSMKTRRVGVVCNPAKSGWYLKLARQAASNSGIELVVREVSSPRETIAQLNALAGNVDALWMLPDSTAVTKETSEAYFHFGQQHSLPVVSFSASYLGLGAVAVLDIDRPALGVQASALVAELLGGFGAVQLPTRFPHVARLKTNPNIVNLLKLAIE